MAKQGIVSIGLQVDYKDTLQKMIQDFNSTLQKMSKDAKEVKWSKDVAKNFDSIHEKIQAVEANFKEMFDDFNTRTVSADGFEKYQKEVSGHLGKINTDITNLTTRLNNLGNQDYISGLVSQFETLQESVKNTYRDIGKVMDFTSKSSVIDLDVIKRAEAYKKTIQEIKSLEGGGTTTTVKFKVDNGKITNIEEAIEKYRKLVGDFESLENTELNLFDKLDSSLTEDNLKNEKELYVVRQKMVNLLMDMRQLYSTINSSGAEGVKQLLKEFDNPNNIEPDIKSINEYIEAGNNFIQQNKEMIESYKKTQTQLDALVTEFKVKNGAIHIPIEIEQIGKDHKGQLLKQLNELQDALDKRNIIAKVKLTLDGGSSKGRKTNADFDKQQIEGQAKPAIDLTETLKKAYREGAKEAEEIVKTSIAKIEKEFESVPIKIHPDGKAFTKELKAMINDSFEAIAKEATGIDVNKELEKLVSNLKEISTSLSGNDSFKFGLDENSIKRITDAIDSMANMIQRAFKVASDNDIAAQWTVLEDKFRSVANSVGHIDARTNKGKEAMQELAAEYKKYLDMGGSKDLSDLTNDTKTVEKLIGYYNDLVKAIEETTRKQEKQAKQKTKKVSSEEKEAIKAISDENKKLETQAVRTSSELEKEGKVAQSAAAKFRKLAKEKGVAVVANRELAKAAKETAAALEKEAEIRKQTGTKTGKGAVNPGVYMTDALKWRKEIEQSLLDSGNYDDIYGAKISQAANGIVTFKAYVKDLNGEWQILSATVNEFGNIGSPKIQEATEKQVITIEKAKLAWEKYVASLAGGDKNPTFLNRTELEQSIATIIEAEEELDRFKIKKVSLSDSGRLAITTELEEANGQIKTFTAYFKDVGDIIDAETGSIKEFVDETTGAVKSFSDMLEDAFNSGQFVVSTRNLADEARGVFDKFMSDNSGNSSLSHIITDLTVLEAAIENIGTKDELNKFNEDLSKLGDKLDLMSKASRAFNLFELNNKGDANFKEVASEVSTLFDSIGDIDSQDKLDKFNNSLSELGARLKTIASDNKLGELFKTNQSFTGIKEVADNLDVLLADIGEVNKKSIDIKGLSKLTAEVKDANGEIHKMTINLDSNNFARFIDNGIKAKPFNAEELNDYVSKIRESVHALEDFNTKYKVVLNTDGSLTITKELQEANGVIKTFVTKFNDIGSVIDTTTGSVRDLGVVLQDAFDSGKVTVKSRNLVGEAQDAFEAFEKVGKSKSGFKYVDDEVKELKDNIEKIKDLSGLDEFSNKLETLAKRLKLTSSAEDLLNKAKGYNWANVSDEMRTLMQNAGKIKDQEGLDKFKQDLDDVIAKIKSIEKVNGLGELFDGTTKTFRNINEVRANLDSLFASIGKVNEKSIKISGANTLTAEVKAANGEIRNMVVNLDTNGFARFVDAGVAQFGRLRESAEGVFKGIQSMVRIYLSPQDFIRYSRTGFDKVREIDTAMTELRKVSDAPSGDIAAYFDSATESAKELGSSVNEMISATADWSRVGYNLPEAHKLAEVAVLYKNVGDGIDIDAANESLVSTLQGFQMEASEAESIVDSFNAVSNNFAISSGGIGEALKRSAAAFNAANTDLNQAIALITAGNEIVQSPEKVGTMWQTVSARIRGTKSELEELGEDTNNVMSSSKLRDLVKAYTDVDIMKDTNTYKDMYTIISEIGKVWKDLEDVDKAALLEALAGKKQSNTLAAVLNNYERLEDIYETAEGSAGSARKEQAKYSESIQYSIDQLTAHIEEFWQTFINKDDVKDFIDLLNDLLSKATGLVDTFGAIPTTVGIFALFKGFQNKGLFRTFEDGTDGILSKIGFMNRSFKDWGAQVSGSFKKAEAGGNGFMTFLNKMGAATKTAFVPDSIDGQEWIKNKDGDVVDKGNIDTYIPEIDLEQGEEIANTLKVHNALVQDGQASWDDFYKTLEDGNENYIPDVVKSTEDLSKIQGKDIVKANKAARQSTINYNNGLKQMTLRAKAARFALQALSAIAMAVITTAIMSGISYLMNAEDRALEKAEEAHAKAQEEVEKLEKREKAALSTSKELSEILSAEDWGAESAQKASEVYNELADQLEEIGGAEESRIQQLRNEANNIKNNIKLSKEEREEKAKTARKQFLDDAEWGTTEKDNKSQSELGSAQHNFWSKVDNEFSSIWNWSRLSATGAHVHALKGDVLSPDKKSKEDSQEKTLAADEILKKMSPYIDMSNGAEYIAFTGDDQYSDAVGFMETFEWITNNVDNAANTDLYDALEVVYNGLSPEYEKLKAAEAEKKLSDTKATAYKYLKGIDFTIESKESKKDLEEKLRAEHHSENDIKTVMDDLESGGFFGEAYQKDIQRSLGLFQATELSASSLEKLSGRMETFSSVLKSISDEGKITADAIRTLKDALGLPDEEWAKWEGKLWNTEPGTETYEQLKTDLIYEMLDNSLTIEGLKYATDTEIANAQKKVERELDGKGIDNSSVVAREYIQYLQAKEQVQGKLQPSSSNLQEINSLISEAFKSNILTESYVNLIMREITSGNNNLSEGDKIKSMRQLFAQIGVGEEVFKNSLNAPIEGSPEKQQEWAQANGFETKVKKDVKGDVVYTTDSKGNKVEDWVWTDISTGVQYENIKEAVLAIAPRLIQEYFGGSSRTNIVTKDEKAKQKTLKKTTKDYLENIADIEEDLAKKEKDFAENMAEAWKKDHLEVLKDGLAKQKDIIDRYKKNVEVADFGLEYVEADDFSNRADILTNKLDNLKSYGMAMREEFDRVANTIPQTGDEAVELANRLEELGSEMRSNVSAIRETTVELQKLSIDIASTLVEDRMGELQAELDNIDKRINILNSDYKDDYQYANNVLSMEMLLPTYSEYDKSRRDKQRADSAVIESEQETQDKINEIVSESLKKQAEQNAEARDKERQKLREDIEEVRKDAKKKLDEAHEDFADFLEANNIDISTAVTTIENMFADADLKLPEIDITTLDSAIATIKQKLKEAFDDNEDSDSVISEAESYIGTPYLYGGSSRIGIDCSALVQKALSANGISISRTAAGQWNDTTRVNKEDLQPGDLVFFQGTNKNKTGITHVGIYKGEGQFIHASSSKGVTISSLDEDYYVQHWAGGGRYASGTPFGNAMANKLGLAGENYKPEILIDKATGKATYIDRPTVIDPSKTDVVGEKATAKIPKFADGTLSTTALRQEYQKVTDWGLGSYLQAIKNGTIQSVFGNVDMDKRTIITWSEELKETYKDALASWEYDPEIGSIDTVFGGSNRFGEDINGAGWEVAFTPILPDGTFLSKDTVNAYINSILKEAYENDDQISEDELKSIDAQGKQIGETFVRGIFAGVDDSLSYDNNGNWAETVGRLMHFSGSFGAVELAKKDIMDGMSTDFIDSFYERITSSISRIEADTIMEVQNVLNNDELSDFDKSRKLYDIKYNKGIEASKIGEEIYQELATSYEVWLEAVKSDPAKWSLEVYNAYRDAFADISDLTYNLADSAVKDKQSEAEASWQNSLNWINERKEKGDWSLYGDSEEAAWKRVYERFITEYPKELDKINEASRNIVETKFTHSSNWINERNTFNDWKLFDDTEVDAWERVVKWLHEDYPNDINKIKEAEQSLFEARKKEFSQATSFGNTYLESQKKLLQSYHDVSNAVGEAFHEINKDLETSKTMYEWLDEDTRQLLFNQEDYNELSEELLDIQYKADKLQRQHQRDLEGATLENIESITANYERQYETLMKSYEIAKADLEVAKKKQKLNNVLNERNVRMFINGSWQWVANTEDVINAKSELADAEYAKQVEEAGLTQKKSIDALTEQQDKLNLVVKKFENGVISLQEAVGLAGSAIGYIPQAMVTMLKNAKVDTKSYSSGSSSKSYGGVWYDSNANYMDNIRNASSVEEVIANNNARNAKILGDGRSEGIMSNEDAIDEWLSQRVKGYATGTRYTAGGLTRLGEVEEEVYITSTGRLIPITSPTIGDVPSGGIVFNTEQMKNLRTMWDMSNFNWNNASSHIENAQPQQIDQSQDNRIIINGMTVDSGSADGQALISALRRYVGNH